MSVLYSTKHFLNTDMCRELPSIAKITANVLSIHTRVCNTHDSSKTTRLIQQKVVKSVAECSPVDYIVCAHKAIDQDEVAVQLQPAVNDKTTIVVIQNGVGNEEPFRKHYPDNSIITCVVSFQNLLIQRMVI
jgi:ketopantoate reductase